MPLASRVYQFPELSHQSFRGLPGLLADSLPDKFGNANIDTWLAAQGQKQESFHAVERLCHIGTRGMGALEFKPDQRRGKSSSSKIHVAKLVKLVSDNLTHRSSLATVFADREDE